MGYLCLSHLYLQIREEHHVFKANSTKYAGEIIHFFYPQDIVISAVQVAEMIETLCSATPTTMSNFLALRNASPAPYSEVSRITCVICIFGLTRLT